jgi:hypothetical protein
LVDCIHELGFFRFEAELDIWMKKGSSVYEYVTVYVDDLAMAMHEPAKLISTKVQVSNNKQWINEVPSWL